MMSEQLNFNHLLTFRALVTHRNFTRAAESLDLTQPAVTQHVHALERHFGVKLVDIVGRRMHLTAAGDFLADRAERLLGATVALEREMREFADVASGELRLGVTVTIGSHALAPIVAAFRDRFPHIVLDVRVDNTSVIAGDVRNGLLSLALVEGELDDPALDIVPYQNDALVLVVRPDHRFARSPRAIGAEAMRDEAFIAREPGSGTRAFTEAVLQRNGIVPNVVLALQTSSGIIQAVEAGIGIAIVSALVARDAVRSGSLVEVGLRGIAFHRAFKLVRRKFLTPSPAARAFSAIAREVGSAE